MATRNSILRKLYVYPDGSTSRSAKPGWASVRFDVFSGFTPGATAEDKPTPVVGKSIGFSREDASRVMDCAFGHGLMQKIGDEIAGWQKKAEKASAKADWNFVVGLIEDMIDTLTSGVWVEEGEGSSAGNVTLLFQALVAAYEEALGRPLTDEGKAAMLGKLSEKAEREAAKAIPQVAKHLARLTAERAAARAEEAAKASEGSGAEKLSAFLASATATSTDDADEDVEVEDEVDTDE